MNRNFRFVYMNRALGVILAVIFAILSLLHFYWAAGGRFGVGSAIPQVNDVPAFTPSPLATVLVGIALLLAMLTILGQIELWGKFIPKWIFRGGTLGLSLIFFLRAIGEFNLVGFFKKSSDSAFAFWDTFLFSPLCLFIAVLAFLISYKK